MGLLMWGYGLWWFVMAVLITLRYLCEGLPFNMGWWGFTFPIGVYAVAMLALGRQTNMALFTTIGGVLVVALAGFWLLVSMRTLHGAYQGYLLVASYLSGETGLFDGPSICPPRPLRSVCPRPAKHERGAASL